VVIPVGTVQVSEPVLFHTSEEPVELEAAVVVATAMLVKPPEAVPVMLVPPTVKPPAGILTLAILAAVTLAIVILAAVILAVTILAVVILAVTILAVVILAVLLTTRLPTLEVPITDRLPTLEVPITDRLPTLADPLTTRLLLTFKLPVMLALPAIFIPLAETPLPISYDMLSAVIGTERVTEPPAGEMSLIEAAINFSLYS
jgi:hypothetical protein